MTCRSMFLAYLLAVLSPLLSGEESYIVFVDPGKEDFGPVLRANLELIHKEG